MRDDRLNGMEKNVINTSDKYNKTVIAWLVGG